MIIRRITVVKAKEKTMKAHKVVMIILAALGVGILLFGPALNISRAFGFILLICPLMMLGMMGTMGHNKGEHK